MFVALVLAGCGKIGGSGGQEERNNGNAAAATTATTADDDAPYDTHLPMSEFMEHVMQNAGNGVWKWQGVVLDKEGEHSLYPKNDEEWEEAESGALTLAEATNLLLIPGRRIVEPGWDNSVDKVRGIALKAAAAAEKHDQTAFLAAGAALDDACDACHVRYDPNFKSPPQ